MLRSVLEATKVSRVSGNRLNRSPSDAFALHCVFALFHCVFANNKPIKSAISYLGSPIKQDVAVSRKLLFVGMSPRVSSPPEVLLYTPVFVLNQFFCVKDLQILCEPNGIHEPDIAACHLWILVHTRFAVNVQVTLVLDLDVILVLRKKDFDAQSALTDVLGHC